MMQKENLEPKDILIFGEGSNMIVSEKAKPNVVLINNKGKEVFEKELEVYLKANAGEKFDDIIDFSVANNFADLESLSAIPGKVGAVPYQNVGAYGLEAKDVVYEVLTFDLLKNEFKTFSNTECEFSYRNSIFKKEENKNRFIILSVTFILKKGKQNKVPDYKQIKDIFEGKELADIREIRKVITSVRWQKLPKPSELPNVGSFFHNPIIKKEDAEKLLQKYPNLPIFEYSENEIKVPAGYLLEQLGLKGFRFKNLGLYEKHALVMVNFGNSSFVDLLEFIDFIKEKVKVEFDIELVVEPILL